VLADKAHWMVGGNLEWSTTLKCLFFAVKSGHSTYELCYSCRSKKKAWLSAQNSDIIAEC